MIETEATMVTEVSEPKTVAVSKQRHTRKDLQDVRADLTFRLRNCNFRLN